MWPFKKKEPPALIKPPPCNHKWKDFPWYTIESYDYSSRVVCFSVYEPYVCIYCKERKDVCLEKHKRFVGSRLNADKYIIKRKEELGSNWKPRAIVEDMINDFQLVDREHLKIAEALRSGPVVSFRNEIS